MQTRPFFIIRQRACPTVDSPDKPHSELTFSPGCVKKALLFPHGVWMKKAVILLGHGSRNAEADGTIRRVASEVRGSGGFHIVAHAFLQYMKPGPDEVLEQCVKDGAEMIVVVPFFLQPGAHVTKDLPALIEKARMQYPDVAIMVTELVGSHPLMTDIVLELAKKHN